MKLSEWITGKKKGIFLGISAFLGILLIFFGSMNEKKGEEKKTVPEKNSVTLSYMEHMENKIKNIAEGITGSAKVRVILYAETGSEFLYLQNEESREGTDKKEYVTLRGKDGMETPVLLQEKYPEIVGISVACKGGDDPVIAKKLLDTLTTAFRIGSNRICIVGI